MTPFPQPLVSRAAPLMTDNIDTDTIIPSREMRSTGRSGLADGLFAPWRYINAEQRQENPEFVLNQSGFRDARILLGGANFGCGSSREHAVWALAEWGICCVIADSFAPIFQGNCTRNGVLPITLSRPAIECLAGEMLTVSLAEETVTSGEITHRFSIDSEARLMLAGGLDAIDLTSSQLPEIEAWTARDQVARPWVYLGNSSRSAKVAT